MMVLLGDCDEFTMAEEMWSPRKYNNCPLSLILPACPESVTEIVIHSLCISVHCLKNMSMALINSRIPSISKMP